MIYLDLVPTCLACAMVAKATVNAQTQPEREEWGGGDIAPHASTRPLHVALLRWLAKLAWLFAGGAPPAPRPACGRIRAQHAERGATVTA